MHGKGTFSGRDGASYDGSWLDDLKHGLGESHCCPQRPLCRSLKLVPRFWRQFGDVH